MKALVAVKRVVDYNVKVRGNRTLDLLVRVENTGLAQGQSEGRWHRR